MTTTTTDNQYLIPQGDWRAMPIDGVFTSSKAGKDMECVTFRMSEGPGSGKHIRWYGNFEKGFDQTCKTLKVLGWDEETDLATWKPKQAEVILVIEHHLPNPTPDYPNPKLQARIKFVNSLTGGQAVIAMPLEKAKQASAEIIARLKQKKSGNGDGAPVGAEPNAFNSGGQEEEDKLPY